MGNPEDEEQVRGGRNSTPWDAQSKASCTCRGKWPQRSPVVWAKGLGSRLVPVLGLPTPLSTWAFHIPGTSPCVSLPGGLALQAGVCLSQPSLAPQLWSSRPSWRRQQTELPSHPSDFSHPTASRLIKHLLQATIC